ncbi:hypothetical protein H1R20_g13800, partial [Candolleomyces eurysporus]
MKILPKASRFDVGSMARLDDLCCKARECPIGRDEKSAFYEFALGFQAEVEPLLKSGVIANLDLVLKFIGGLKSTFRDGLSERLSCKTPAVDADGVARDEEDPFTLVEVIKVATEMVDVAAVGPFGALAYVEEEADYAQNMTSSGLSDHAESAGLKALKVKQESMTEEMAKVPPLRTKPIQGGKVLALERTPAEAPAGRSAHALKQARKELIMGIMKEIFSIPHPMKLEDLAMVSPITRQEAIDLLKKGKWDRSKSGQTEELRGALLQELEDTMTDLGQDSLSYLNALSEIYSQVNAWKM